MSDGNAEARAARMADLLEEQLAVYREVLEVSRRQDGVIAGKDTAALMDLLAGKQKLIGRIDALSREVEPLRAAWDGMRDDVAAATRGRVEAAVEALRTVLAEIVSIEDAGREKLEGMKNDTGQNIAKMQKGKALHKAYGVPKPPPTARYKDRNI